MLMTVPLEHLDSIKGLNNYNLNQDRRIKSNQLDAKLDYYNIINKQEQHKPYPWKYCKQAKF